MQTLAFTGARKLTSEQVNHAHSIILSLPRCLWLVGCAPGLDAIARELAPKPFVLFEAQGTHVYHYQKRSKNMIDALAAAGGTLHAFPNKPCPQGLTLDSWKGSGTWGTIFYAHSLGCPVELHLLAEVDLPSWLTEQVQQLQLF
ncbi:MAG: hypothetical protein NW224_11985 [Leptolyngbyaceae cyanobacterium bins.302]|nr:hypothetical protein [Leptolyngbyaceae cyanobacterium bins.302]